MEPMNAQCCLGVISEASTLIMISSWAEVAVPTATPVLLAFSTGTVASNWLSFSMAKTLFELGVVMAMCGDGC